MHRLHRAWRDSGAAGAGGGDHNKANKDNGQAQAVAAVLDRVCDRARLANVTNAHTSGGLHWADRGDNRLAASMSKTAPAPPNMGDKPNGTLPPLKPLAGVEGGGGEHAPAAAAAGDICRIEDSPFRIMKVRICGLYNYAA